MTTTQNIQGSQPAFIPTDTEADFAERMILDLSLLCVVRKLSELFDYTADEVFSELLRCPGSFREVRDFLMGCPLPEFRAVVKKLESMAATVEWADAEGGLV